MLKCFFKESEHAEAKSKDERLKNHILISKYISFIYQSISIKDLVVPRSSLGVYCIQTGSRKTQNLKVSEPFSIAQLIKLRLLRSQDYKHHYQFSLTADD